MSNTSVTIVCVGKTEADFRKWPLPLEFQWNWNQNEEGRTVLTGVQGPVGITSTFLSREKPGDSFSRMRLGMIAFLESGCTGDVESLKDRLYDSQLMVGVVAEPEIEEVDGRGDWIYAAAGFGQGFIFNGNGFISPDGKILAER